MDGGRRHDLLFEQRRRPALSHGSLRPPAAAADAGRGVALCRRRRRYTAARLVRRARRSQRSPERRIAARPGTLDWPRFLLLTATLARRPLACLSCLGSSEYAVGGNNSLRALA